MNCKIKNIIDKYIKELNDDENLTPLNGHRIITNINNLLYAEEHYKKLYVNYSIDPGH